MVPELDPASATYPVREGHHVAPLIDGHAAFAAIEHAIVDATTSITVTVAFVTRSFRFPRSGAPMLRLLSEAAGRGVDVHIVFWRHGSTPEALATSRLARNGDWFTPADIAAEAPGVSARWDHVDDDHCHHQKTWVIDAESASGGIAFVGGMNINPKYVGDPADPHADGSFHDVYVQLAGPAVADVHHNAVQRWNQASDRDHGGAAGPRGAEPMSAVDPTIHSSGGSVVQVQRTIAPDLYGAESPHAYDTRTGERSILEQYRLALDAATSTIHIENQALLSQDLLPSIVAAARRGVTVTGLVPCAGEGMLRRARLEGTNTAAVSLLDELAELSNVRISGLVRDVDGRATEVYVHSKLMIVDDEFVTIGSANLRDNSMRHNSELNLAIWDTEFASSLRVQLDRHYLDGATRLHPIDLRQYGRPNMSVAPSPL